MSTDIPTAVAASRLWDPVLEVLVGSTTDGSFPLDPLLLVLALFVWLCVCCSFPLDGSCDVASPDVAHRREIRLGKRQLSMVLVCLYRLVSWSFFGCCFCWVACYPR